MTIHTPRADERLPLLAKVPSASHTVLRGDIQGLRAIAVLAVVIDHSLGWPGGGFVGVDVFFVISGFLITGLLLRERERTGKISFANFYRRRIKRILPAALLVIVATIIASRFLLNESRFAGILGDSVAAFFFSANWRMAASGTDYFQEGSGVSPLQHFWSLAVEEQYYFVWPVVMLLAFFLAGRFARGTAPNVRIASGIAIAVLGIASFSWAVFETATSPTVAYFSTFSRAWELAVGAGLAIAAPQLERVIPHVIRPIVAWVGLVGIAVSIFVTSDLVGFPAPGAAFAVVSVALVIAAGTGGQQRYLFPLTNPVSGYLGDTSYSLYLWHFPVIILFGPYLQYLLGGATGPLYYVLLLGTAFALALAAYHLVETPIRKSRWLSGKAVPSSRRRRVYSVMPAVIAVSATAVTATAVVIALSFNSLTAPAVVPSGEGAAGSPGDGTSEVAAETSTAQTELSAQITAALAATEWPADLTPTVADAGSEAVPGNTGICGAAKWQPASECTFGDPNSPKTALLVGDSIAQAYVPALVELFGTGDWHLRITSMYACPFIDADFGDLAPRVALCADRKVQEYQAIAETSPDLLIIGNTYVRGKDTSTGVKASLGAWSEGFSSMIATVASQADQFVVLPPPAPDKEIETCYTPFSSPADCVSSVSNTDWVTMAQDQQATVVAAGGVFIDNRLWYCNQDGDCPAFVGNILMKKDFAHMTAAYTALLVPVMHEAFAAAGISDALTAVATDPAAEPAAEPTSAPASAG